MQLVFIRNWQRLSMIYWKIYKIKTLQLDKYLYNLWWKELIVLQRQYTKKIQKMLDVWYQETLKTIENDMTVKYNDLYIDQSQFVDIEKAITGDDFYMATQMLQDGFNVGAKQINKAFSNDVRIDATFGLDPSDALSYSNDKAWQLITGIDNVAKKRINNIISTGIEKWWWYNKLADELKRDFAFSNYRAKLIASNEIGDAYLQWKDAQFNRYRNKFNMNWYKKWMSHKDDRTNTDICLPNDEQGWIPYDQMFQSGHAWPLGHIWCRCNCTYSLFKPDGDDLTPDDATIIDEIQTEITEDNTFDEWLRPDNYDTISTQALPPNFFNAIGEKAVYSKWGIQSYYTEYNGFENNIINLWSRWKKTQVYARKVTEVHEAWHFMFTKKIMKNKEMYEKALRVFDQSFDEIAEKIQDKIFADKFTSWYNTFELAKDLLEELGDLAKENQYFIDNVERTSRGIKYMSKELSERFAKDFSALMDTLWSVTREKRVGAWHGSFYYMQSEKAYYYKWVDVREKQLQEFFAHLNEVHFMDNPLIKKYLPETYNAMKWYYTSIWMPF